MDTPSTLLIIDYPMLKMQLVAYYLQIRPFSCRFYCLAAKKTQKLRLSDTKQVFFFVFVSAGCYCSIQWTEYITVAHMLMQKVLENLSLTVSHVLLQQADAFGKILLKSTTA